MKQRLLIIVVGIVLGLAARYAREAFSTPLLPAAEAQASEKLP